MGDSSMGWMENITFTYCLYKKATSTAYMSDGLLDGWKESLQEGHIYSRRLGGIKNLSPLQPMSDGLMGWIEKIIFTRRFPSNR
jgi:hypothetical protein